MTPSTTPVPLLPASAPVLPPVAAPPGPPLWGLSPEDVPDIEPLVIEDGKPVDGIFSEKQMRLLTEPLHSSWPGPAPGVPFVAMANVGVFHTTGEPPIVPDALLAVGVSQGQDLNRKENLSYFVWLRGKVPDVAFEIVSNREGGEDTDKFAIYARIGVPYYVIYDPRNLLRQGTLRVFQRQGGTYRLLEEPWWFAEVNLGVMLWEGRYEDEVKTWVRWCDRDGQLIPTGAERAEHEQQRANQEYQRAEHEQQRAEEEQQRADQERQRAEHEQHRADQERQRAEEEQYRAEQAQQELERLREHLRRLGIDPPA